MIEPMAKKKYSREFRRQSWARRMSRDASSSRRQGRTLIQPDDRRPTLGMTANTKKHPPLLLPAGGLLPRSYATKRTTCQAILL
jgi:hypothetical protein